MSDFIEIGSDRAISALNAFLAELEDATEDGAPF